MIGNFTRNMNLESEIQKTWILKFYIKYLTNSKCFSDFCKNFQGKFFFNSQLQSSIIKCTYWYTSLALRIFFNPYPIKAHCEQHCWRHRWQHSFQTNVEIWDYIDKKQSTD